MTRINEGTGGSEGGTDRNGIRKGVKTKSGMEKWCGKMKRERKKSEVGRGKRTNITGQAVVQGNVEVLTRGLPSTATLQLFVKH